MQLFPVAKSLVNNNKEELFALGISYGFCVAKLLHDRLGEKKSQGCKNVSRDAEADSRSRYIVRSISLTGIRRMERRRRGERKSESTDT